MYVYLVGSSVLLTWLYSFLSVLCVVIFLFVSLFRQWAFVDPDCLFTNEMMPMRFIRIVFFIWMRNSADEWGRGSRGVDSVEYIPSSYLLFLLHHTLFYFPPFLFYAFLKYRQAHSTHAYWNGFTYMPHAQTDWCAILWCIVSPVV